MHPQALLFLCALGSAPAFALAIQEAKGEAKGELVALPDLGLTLQLPALEGLRSLPSGEQVEAAWTGQLGSREVKVTLFVLEREKLGIEEPEDVTDLAEQNQRRKGNEETGFAYDRRELLAGPFGWTPYASLASGPLEDAGRLYVLGGVLEPSGYALEIECRPAPDPAADAALAEFLRERVAYEGAVRDARWSQAEIVRRWEEHSPEDARRDLEKPIFTDHYVIFGNSSGGKVFAKKMEECYATIRKVYPFPEVPGRRLMPVFLFRTADQYYAYMSSVARISVESARRSKGHAWRDYYATWYEAPSDPVHIHEATHQIFANRLRLGGGGSWFQEGVAEYIETKPGDRAAAAGAVKRGRHTPLREFVRIRSLLMSAEEDVKGGNEAGDHYKQAALLIEFLRESEFGRHGFQDFLHAVGRLRSSDEAAIQAAVQRVYEVDLDGLEKAWIAYCKKR